jgi:hypothetical protein
LRFAIFSAIVFVRFPISMFNEVAGIVPFVRKKTRIKPLTENERERAALTLKHYRLQYRNIIEQNEAKTGKKAEEGMIHHIS